MAVIVDLSPGAESALSDLAAEAGEPVAEFARRLVEQAVSRMRAGPGACAAHGSQSGLKPLIVLEGRVPVGWKDVIYPPE